MELVLKEAGSFNIKHMAKHNPDAWNNVKKQKGKLKGMLTDDLANNIFNFVDGIKTTGTSGGKVVSNPLHTKSNHINRALPNKFK